MGEVIEIPAALGLSGSIEVGRTVIGALVRADKLPADFYFRALSLENEERTKVVAQDVLAAAGLGEPSGRSYLRDELPDCIYVPVDEPKELRQILAQLDTDYHMLGDLTRIAGEASVAPHMAQSAWFQYIEQLSPRQYAILWDLRTRSQERHIGPQLSRRRNYMHRLFRTVIRDSGLIGIYRDDSRLVNHGWTRRRLLRGLLLGNHPELAEGVEVAEEV